MGKKEVSGRGYYIPYSTERASGSKCRTMFVQDTTRYQSVLIACLFLQSSDEIIG